jgi:ribosome maturation factor RimP
MTDKEVILKIIEEQIKDSDLFLIDLRIGKDNKISVVIDGDNGVKIQDCINLSRFVEKRLDREAEDFELNVLSSGVGEPLKLMRQYKKNIGRNIEITTFENERFEGELTAADEDKVLIRLKTKHKKDIATEKQISFSDIKEGKIIILF